MQTCSSCNKQMPDDIQECGYCWVALIKEELPSDNSWEWNIKNSWELPSENSWAVQAENYKAMQTKDYRSKWDKQLTYWWQKELMRQRGWVPEGLSILLITLCTKLRNKEEAKELKTGKKLEWFWGWLSIVWILLFAHIGILWTNIFINVALFNDGTFAQILNSESMFYIWWALPILILDFFGTLFFFIVTAILIAYYFSKHVSFPWFYKAYQMSLIVFTLASTIMMVMTPKFLSVLSGGAEPDINGEILSTVHYIVFPLFLCAYMHVSKRVQNTFTQKCTHIKVLPAIWSWLCWAFALLVLATLNPSALSYDAEQYGNDMCLADFWEHAIYVGYDETWYFCDCEPWYIPAVADGVNKCVSIGRKY